MNSKVKKTLAYMLCFSMIVSAGMTGVHSEEAPAEETEEVIDHEDTVEADAAGEEAPEIKVEVDPEDKPEE